MAEGCLTSTLSRSRNYESQLRLCQYSRKSFAFWTSSLSWKQSWKQSWEAELEARRRQYEQYRRHLMVGMSGNDRPMGLLGDLCDFKRGRWVKADDLPPGDVPVVTSARSVKLYTSESNRRGKTVTVASSGAYAGHVSIWREPIYLSNAFSVDTKDPNVLDPEFLFLCLEDTQDFIYSLSSVAGVPNIYGSDIADIEIPVPSLSRQREVVSVLESLSSLVNDLSSGLPAEIAARRRQYEYYREKLLTFKEADV
jgi:type I restriction enzyme, S subunit